MQNRFVLKGTLYFCPERNKLTAMEGGYTVCEGGFCLGVYQELPPEFSDWPLEDHGDCLILPGLVDLHIHAPQYAYWGLGMDLELIDWLNQHAFAEEEKYRDFAYAEKAYGLFAEDIRRGPNTRACIFATCHTPTTLLLMDLLEHSGLVSYVGRVNMDRNSSPGLQEESAEAAVRETEEWIRLVLAKGYANTRPILTPRFIPSCSDELMRGLRTLSERYALPLQSHLSENLAEVEWVGELCPSAAGYAGAYHDFGLFGGDCPTVMAHCVWLGDQEMDLMRNQSVFAAHCPQSNMNLSSGIAPMRKLLDRGIAAGLGSDVAGGCHSSIFRAMTDAIQVSKLYWRLVDSNCIPLRMEEAFYLGTMGGGAFFGKTGTFLPGYEFDALVIDDSQNRSASPPDKSGRLSRLMYQPENARLIRKYVRGKDILRESSWSPRDCVSS